MTSGIIARAEPHARSITTTARCLLASLCGASALLLVILGTRLSFFNDDWWFLLQRPGLESHGGLDTVLAPHNGNLEVLLAAAYKALTAVFGMGSQVPFRVVMAAGVICLGVLVYSMVADRLGIELGLAAAAVVLFLGPAWEALLFFGGSNHLDAVVFGLAALVALERDTPTRNALACALLVLAVSISNTGAIFLVGAVVALLLRRELAAMWIVAVPAALFGLWWAFYGHEEPTGFTLGHVEHLPRYVFDSFSSGLAAITGVEQVQLPGVVSSGHILAALVLLLLILWLARGGRPPAPALVPASALLAFWLLTGASAITGRPANSSRYQIVDAVLLIVVGAELLRGTRLVGRARSALAVVAVPIVASNLIVMRHGYDFLRLQSGYAKAALGALEIARPLAPRGLWLLPPTARNPYLSGVTADRYFAVTKAHGAPPVYNASQILSALPLQRQAADSVVAAAYRISVRPAASISSVAACGRLPNGAERAVKPPGAVVRNLSPVVLAVGVSRFAPPGMPVYVGFLWAHATARVEIPLPADAVATRWRITLVDPRRVAGAATRVCQAVG